MKKPKNAARPKFVNIRKAARKEKRLQKKLHKREHYQKKKNVQDVKKYEPGQFVRRPTDFRETNINNKKKKNKDKPTSLDILSKERHKEMSEAEKLKHDMEEQRRQILLKANEEEDKIIKKLEKQLGLNKSKNKNNRFAEDGLDYVLEICDRTTSEQIVAAEKHLADVEGDSDFDEDLAVVTGKEMADERHSDKKAKKNSKISSNIKNNGISQKEEDDSNEEMSVDEGSDDERSDGEGSNNEDFSEEGNEEKSDDNETDISGSESNCEGSVSKNIPKKENNVPGNELHKVFSEDEISHLSDDDDLENEIDFESSKEQNVDNAKSTKKPDVWEDIYGRKRDKDGNIIKEEKGVYIPPHLRNKDSATDKDLEQIKRQIKSVLNKLSGSNLHWACAGLEGLYRAHSRHAVSAALCALWMQATVGPSATPDRLVAEHAALVAVLHANVATEIGAHFLQELTKKFDEMVDAPHAMEDKRLENLTSCLSHLYCFKVCHSALLFDVMRRLLERVSEQRVACVVAALRCAGGALRKDDPPALRDFIHDTQAQIAQLSEEAARGSRIKFLLEVLMAVKNNNLAKIPNYDPTYVENLKKNMRAVVRKGNYVTPLNIRLEDLLKADERGKWWIVGSAWEGNRVRQEEQTTAKPLPSTDQKLLELARKQRMNTDVRRSIFCVIMSAEDYMDAFEKLQHLGLRGQQEREVVHVLLACCLQERVYNPYYAVLAQKLSEFDRKYQLSIQFSVWDKIKEMETLPKQSLSNLAQFLIHLIMQKGLPLSVLKIIQFSDLNKRSVRFMRQILLAVIMNADLQAVLEVFHRISKSPKLHMFRESLRLFIQHFLIKNAGKKSNVLSEEEMETLRERAVEVEKILIVHESKLRF